MIPINVLDFLEPGDTVQSQLLRYIVTRRQGPQVFGIVTAVWLGKWVDPKIDLPEHELYDHVAGLRSCQWEKLE